MNANARSNACLTMNCQPRGFVGWSVISGSPPTWSSVARSLIDSYSRGISETPTPSRSHSLTRSTRTWSGSVENARITCRAAVRCTAAARSWGPPRIGSDSWPAGRKLGSGSSSRYPIGRRPYVGSLTSRLTRCSPTCPAPTISVGVANALVRIACLRTESRTARATARYTPPNSHSRTAIPTGCAAPAIEASAIVSIAASETTPSTCVVESTRETLRRSSRPLPAYRNASTISGKIAASHRLATAPLILGSANRARLDATYSTTTSTRSRTLDQLGGSSSRATSPPTSSPVDRGNGSVRD